MISEFAELSRIIQLDIDFRVIKTIMDAAPFCVWCKDYTDGSGTAIYGNQNFALLYGFKLDDWIGHTDFEVFPEATALLWQASDLLALERGAYLQIQDKVAIRDGAMAHAVVYKWRVMSGGKAFVAGFTLPGEINGK